MPGVPSKGPCSYKVRAIRKFAPLRYLSELCFHVLTAGISDLPTVYPCNWNNSEQAIGRAETETVVHYESQH